MLTRRCDMVLMDDLRLQLHYTHTSYLCQLVSSFKLAGWASPSEMALGSGTNCRENGSLSRR